MRWFPVSATTIVPFGPTATAQGVLNCPSPVPGLPSGLPIANWKEGTPWARAGLAPSARLASRKIPQNPLLTRIILRCLQHVLPPCEPLFVDGIVLVAPDA